MASEVFLTNTSSSVSLNASFTQIFRKKGPSLQLAVVVFVCLFVGVLGNLLALVKLARRRTNINRTYTLMLRFLTAYNLIGLLSVATIFSLTLYEPKLRKQKWFCASYVVPRFFGISSGCVAVIMSIDRYIMLNHHTFYQMNLKPKCNTNAILALTVVAGIINFCPLFGFGLYFDEQNKECLNYKQANTPRDRAYAILFLIFGTLICTTIVSCNTLVVRAILLRKRRRLSDTSSSSSELSFKESSNISEIDIRFSKLMVLLSLIFLTCWMPQMILTVLSLQSNPLPSSHWFSSLSNLLIAVLFTLDPYLYVFSGKNIVHCWERCSRSRSSLRIRNEVRTLDSSTEITL